MVLYLPVICPWLFVVHASPRDHVSFVNNVNFITKCKWRIYSTRWMWIWAALCLWTADIHENIRNMVGGEVSSLLLSRWIGTNPLVTHFEFVLPWNPDLQASINPTVKKETHLPFQPTTMIFISSGKLLIREVLLSVIQCSDLRVITVNEQIRNLPF